MPLTPSDLLTDHAKNPLNSHHEPDNSPSQGQLDSHEPTQDVIPSDVSSNASQTNYSDNSTYRGF